MWKLTIEDDEQKQISLPLVHNEYGVGRDEANEIRLTERNISRRHAVLRKNAAGWVVRDLESYNGTYINGLRVAGEQHVVHGDIVQLGDYRLEFIDEARLPGAVSAPEGASPSATLPIAGGPQPLPAHHRPDRLVVVVGPQPGQEFFLDREHFSMGRSEDADISINHSSVSRFHAELFAVGNGRYEIIDKGSANGIRINGQEVRRGFIEAGDALELGDVRLRFVGAGKIFRAGFDRSQALPAITGFDTAMKSSSPAQTSSSSILKMVGVGALLGVLGVGAAAIWLVTHPKPTPKPAPTAEPAPDEGAKILEEAKKLAEEGKLDQAHDKIASIPSESPSLKDAAVKKIEGDWADKVFKDVEAEQEPQKKVDLLWKIRNDKYVDEERRKKAQAILKGMDVEVPDLDIKEEPKPMPAPTIRTPGTFVPRPPPTASAAPVPSGVVDRAALDNQKKKSTDLRARPLSDLSKRELTQLIGLCQAEGDNGCAARASNELKSRE